MTKSGYADHKPPYDFKHGWIPVSSEAQKAHKDKAPAGTPEPTGAASHLSAISANQTKALKFREEGVSGNERFQFAESKLLPERATSVKTKPLDTDEESAISDYQWGKSEISYLDTFHLLNGKLRGSEHVQIHPDEAGDLDLVHRHLLSALSKSKTTRAITVFRGLKDGKPPLKVGDTVTDEAWVSTSYDPDMAQGFAQSSGKVMVIELPKGTNAILTESDEELEILLGPGVPMRVVREDGRYLHMELAQ